MAGIFGSFVTLLIASTSLAQEICKGSFPQLDPTIVAKGFTTYVLARNLSSPRGIIFDKEGNLLVLERSKGITALKLKDDNNCMSVASKTAVVTDENLNHAIQLSPDGTQLFASTRERVFSWPYISKDTSVGGNSTTWVAITNQTGHQTRTLLMSKKAPGMLLVSRGSGPNIDPTARDVTSGVSQIRAFNVSGPPKQYQYTDGKVIGWGLRNSIGLAENPEDGGIWSNENASDKMFREGKDIHESSPGEEINYHGGLLSNTELHGRNYGYPECAAVWDVDVLPNNTRLKVGSQFTYSDSSQKMDDESCQRTTIAPRLTLPSHWAPIDIEFNSKGTVAYMTSHGSWNKDSADGYKLFAITFAKGQPTHPQTSKSAAIPILTLRNMRTCPKGTVCFRPTGVAFDSKGRLYMASDATGEIYVIGRADGGSVDSVGVETLEALERTESRLVRNKLSGNDVSQKVQRVSKAQPWRRV